MIYCNKENLTRKCIGLLEERKQIILWHKQFNKSIIKEWNGVLWVLCGVKQITDILQKTKILQENIYEIVRGEKTNYIVTQTV